jgi:hypothetical protein
LSRIDSGQIEPDIRFTHPAIYASDEVYAKQRHIRDNVGGVVRTLKAKLASPAGRRGGYDYQKAVLLRRHCRRALGIERGEPALDRGDDVPRIRAETQVDPQLRSQPTYVFTKPPAPAARPGAAGCRQPRRPPVRERRPWRVANAAQSRSLSSIGYRETCISFRD